MDTERILVFGPPNAGKSYQFLRIAAAVRGRGARAYVLDSDDSYPRLLSTEFRGLDNVEVYPVFWWQEWVEAVRHVVDRIQPGDWVCVDRADVLWDAVQEYFVERVFGEEMGDYFLEARMKLEANLRAGLKKEAKTLHVLEGDKDWQVINRLYKQLWFNLIEPTFPAHLYVVTAAAKIEKRDEAEVQDTYGWLGMRPTGQKHLVHQVHTVFYFEGVREKSRRWWKITTVKDRGRKPFDHEELVSLPHQYEYVLRGGEQ